MEEGNGKGDGGEITIDMSGYKEKGADKPELNDRGGK